MSDEAVAVDEEKTVVVVVVVVALSVFGMHSIDSGFGKYVGPTLAKKLNSLKRILTVEKSMNHSTKRERNGRTGISIRLVIFTIAVRGRFCFFCFALSDQ